LKGTGFVKVKVYHRGRSGIEVRDVDVVGQGWARVYLNVTGKK
jgi:hypothetical protein